MQVENTIKNEGLTDCARSTWGLDCEVDMVAGISRFFIAQDIDITIMPGLLQWYDLTVRL